MTADTWFLIAIISFALSGIALIVAIFIFIKLNIPSVIGDLSGKTVAREIRAMREANANAPGPAVPAYPGTHSKSNRTMRLPRKSGAYGGVPTGPTGRTAKIAKTGKMAGATSVLPTAEATAVLSNADATAVLSDAGATDVLTDAGATDVLNKGMTAPLAGGTPAATIAANPVPFTVTRSMMFVHTTETV